MPTRDRSRRTTTRARERRPAKRILPRILLGALVASLTGCASRPAPAPEPETPATVLAKRAAPAVAADPTEAYEALPTLRASDFLPADLLTGDHYRVEEAVANDGLFNAYTITSEYGVFHPQSSALARIRIREMKAIAELRDLDKVRVAAGAAVQSVAKMGEGAYHLATNPVETAQGVGAAAGRLFKRVGRSLRRATEKVTADAPDAETAEKSTGEKLAGTSEGIAKDLLGVNRAMRAWAQKLSVDPYTHNPVLRDELQEVADYEAGGHFSTKLMPFGIVGTVLGSAATVDKLVWMQEPDELQTFNETHLEAMGVAPEDSLALRLNPHYTLAVQSHLVASLDALTDVEGRPQYVAQAAGAEAEVDARFFQEGAWMAEWFHATQSPLIGLASDLPGPCALARGDRFACLYPIDYVVWTESTASNVDLLTRFAQEHYTTATRELWLTGSVSPRSARELAARGWRIHERAAIDLPASPPKVQAAPSAPGS